MLPNFKSWSNFRLMVAIGSVVTITSLILGAVVVQASWSDDSGTPDARTRIQAARSPDSSALGRDQATDAEVQAGAEGAAATRPNLPPIASGRDFRISCPVVERTATQNTCTVESFDGFNDPVRLSCARLPDNLSCSFEPPTVVPRPNGATPFRLILTVGPVASRSYTFDVVGQSGELRRSTVYPWGVPAPPVAVAPARVNPPPTPAPTPQPTSSPAPPAPQQAAAAAAEPTFSFTCGSLNENAKLTWSLAEDGTRVTINCFLSPLNGFDEPVTFKYTQAEELARPASVNFVVEQLQTRRVFDLNFELSDAVRSLPAEQLRPGKDYVIQVTGTSESGKSLTRQVTITVTE